MKFKQCDYIICGLLILYICVIPYLPKTFVVMFNSIFLKLERCLDRKKKNEDTCISTSFIST